MSFSDFPRVGSFPQGLSLDSPRLETASGPRCGYGACSKSGCNCQHFEGSGSTCANMGCGHAYQDHW